MALVLLCVVLLAGGTILILFSRRQLAGSDDAELAGWFVLLGLGLSAAAAFVVDALLFPQSKRSGGELQFVVLRHEGIDDPHFDLMLETTPGSKLATWRTFAWPISETVTLMQLADHRQDYLDYEGEISQDRGHVRRIARGTYQISEEPDGGRRIEWNEPGISPIILRRIEADRWTASAT